MSDAPGTAPYTLVDAQSFQDDALGQQQFALDVLHGLSGAPKTLPSRYFYDAVGSALFQEIMESGEYYVTDCETEIFHERGTELAGQLWDKPFDVVELGAGDGRKTRILLQALRDAGRTFRYVPVDISEAAIADLCAAVPTWFPGLETHGLVSEYFTALRWLHRAGNRPKLVLFLGSNVGNFDGPAARVFLRTLWNALAQGDMLLTGFDLKKDIDRMLSAYNDPGGATRRFNLNLLTRINRELGADFDLAKFQHHGTYNVFSGAMESYLVSLAAQDVWVGALQRSFSFRPFEPIHVEYSFKYLRSDVEALAEDTGFAPVASFEDSRGWFVDALWRAVKGG